MPQLRVIRTIVGDVIFKAENNDRDNPAKRSIGSMGDFAHNDYRFDIPYECIYNSEYPNILCAGRIVSAEDNGIGVLRVIPGCCVTGQAAGVAAAVMADTGKQQSDIYPNVKEILQKQKVIFNI